MSKEQRQISNCESKTRIAYIGVKATGHDLGECIIGCIGATGFGCGGALSSAAGGAGGWTFCCFSGSIANQRNSHPFRSGKRIPRAGSPIEEPKPPRETSEPSPRALARGIDRVWIKKPRTRAAPDSAAEEEAGEMKGAKRRDQIQGAESGRGAERIRRRGIRAAGGFGRGGGRGGWCGEEELMGNAGRRRSVWSLPSF